jgi:hypothetical protein
MIEANYDRPRVMVIAYKSDVRCSIAIAMDVVQARHAA